METRTIKMLSDGRTVELKPQGFGGMAAARVLVGDRDMGTVTRNQVTDAPSGAPTEIAKALYVRGLGSIGLIATEAEAVEAVFTEIDATPEAAAAQLWTERASLIDAIRGAEDQGEADFEAAWARELEDEAFAARSKADEHRAKAMRDLATFDAAHPEIIAEIEAEKEAAVERNTWN